MVEAVFLVGDCNRRGPVWRRGWGRGAYGIWIVPLFPILNPNPKYLRMWSHLVTKLYRGNWAKSKVVSNLGRLASLQDSIRVQTHSRKAGRSQGEGRSVKDNSFLLAILGCRCQSPVQWESVRFTTTLLVLCYWSTRLSVESRERAFQEQNLYIAEKIVTYL